MRGKYPPTRCLAASDVPINKTILRNPTYLTSEEMKLILEESDKGLKDVLFRKKKRDYKYAAFMIRAVVHMLYATGLRKPGGKMSGFAHPYMP